MGYLLGEIKLGIFIVWGTRRVVLTFLGQKGDIITVPRQ